MNLKDALIQWTLRPSDEHDFSGFGVTKYTGKICGEYERAVALLELIVHDQYHTLLHEIQRKEPEGGTEKVW